MKENRGKDVNRKVVETASIRCAAVLAGLALIAAGILCRCNNQQRRTAQDSLASASKVPESDCQPVTRGSPYIPVDSWVYPAVLRLYALGYVDTVYLGMRPWTRASLSRMLDETEDRLEDVDEGPATSEAERNI